MKKAASVLLLVCGLALSSCGEGGHGGDKVAIAGIKEAIQVMSRSDDPVDCTRFSTVRFLEQTTKLDGQAAVAACEEAAVDPAAEDAKKVIVSQIDVGEDSATALAAFEGSSFDGQTVRFALVERDGRWKLEELLGFVVLDAERLVTEMGRELLRKMESPQEAQVAACVIGLLEKMSERELEALMLEEGSDRIFGLAQTCASRSAAV